MTVLDSFKKRLKEVPVARESGELDTTNRVFVLAVLAIVLSTASLAIVGFKKPVPLTAQMVVVDLPQLLREKATAFVSYEGLGNQGIGNDKSAKIAEYARALRAAIETYAAKNGVLVMAKGAVFGGNFQEVTDEIRSLL